MNYQPKNMLVTGSAGFIGCNFVRWMLSHDPALKIVSLDKLTYAGKKENLPVDPRHVLVQGDIADTVLVAALLREHQIDTIVHFAAESHVDRSIAGPAVFIQTNVLGTFALLDVAKRYWLEEQHYTSAQCRFHHISTDEVYGELQPQDPPFTEKTPYHPNSPYSASKASSDHFVRAYHHTYGLPMTLSNCSNNYGPYQHAEKLIPTVIRACRAEKPIPIYGNGKNVRDWLYVEDHCSAIDAILTRGIMGETYNIGGHAELDNLTLIRKICTLMDARLPRKNGQRYEALMSFVPDRLGHDWRYAIDNGKITTTLHWLPQYGLEEGLSKTLDFYLR